ncbi:hypothetical protein HOY82DRAFT_539362 [Tuber indicum]|nr:hypothetical protein HOY82DRAFT_539362 [Tuber indicum]
MVLAAATKKNTPSPKPEKPNPKSKKPAPLVHISIVSELELDMLPKPVIHDTKKVFGTTSTIKSGIYSQPKIIYRYSFQELRTSHSNRRRSLSLPNEKPSYVDHYFPSSLNRLLSLPIPPLVQLQSSTPSSSNFSKTPISHCPILFSSNESMIPFSPPESSKLQQSLASSELLPYTNWLSRKHPALRQSIHHAGEILSETGFIYISVIKESNFVQICTILQDGGVLQYVGVVCMIKDKVKSYWWAQVMIQYVSKQEDLQWQELGETQDFESNIYKSESDGISGILDDKDNLNKFFI